MFTFSSCENNLFWSEIKTLLAAHFVTTYFAFIWEKRTPQGTFQHNFTTVWITNGVLKT